MEEGNTVFNVWMVRAGTGGYLIDEFLKNNIIAIGWNETHEISKQLDYNLLKDLLLLSYLEEEWSDGKINQSAGQIWRFIHDFKIGDRVITYDSSARLYYLGIIKSDYKFSNEYEYNHYREVEWDKNAVERDLLNTDFKNKLGSILTIFEVSREIWDELNKHSKKDTKKEPLVNKEKLRTQEEEDLIQLKDDVSARSKEFIKDIVSNLSWEDTERLIAGLLKSMGYKTRFTTRGGDLGSDIIASPDQLGLEEPRIKVEVKKRTKDKISAPDIRNFIGGLRDHHKGIFVTTSGFSKEARYEAERANFAITLIDSDWLVELIIANYESLDPDIKALIPLRKIYWPV